MADVIVAACAVAGTLAAIAAACFTAFQLKLLRGQVAFEKAARFDTVRPQLTFERATLLGSDRDSRRFVEIVLANVGAGAAVSVMIEAEVSPIDPNIVLGGTTAEFLGQRERRPNAHTRLTSIAAGSSVRAYLLPTGEPGALFSDLGDSVVVVLKCSYTDVHGNPFQYPAEPGRILFRPALIENREPVLAAEL